MIDKRILFFMLIEELVFVKRATQLDQFAVTSWEVEKQEREQVA